MSEFLKAKDILKKVKETRIDFNLKARLQVVKHIKKYTKAEKPYLMTFFFIKPKAVRNVVTPATVAGSAYLSFFREQRR